MHNTDTVTILGIHAILVLFFVSYAILDIVAYRRSRYASVKLDVERGPESMNMLFVMYGVATLVYSIAIQVADYAQGHRSTLIIVDYILMTYLFFFNSRFRNALIRLYIRLKKD